MAAGTPRSQEGAGNGDEEAGEDGLFAEINITPLTDVFLVMVIVIPANGDLAANGTIVKPEQLDNLFRQTYLKDKNTQVVIQADKAVQHGRVVDVMERAKAAGLTKLAIGTTSK